VFGIGASELVLIVVVALVVVGPKNLPNALRTIGRAITQFRNASRELRKEVGYDEVVDEVTRPLREGMAGIQAGAKSIEADVRGLPNATAKPVSASWSNEYPEGGADDYGALPENANVYPDVTPTISTAKAAALEGSVPRSDES
jgi:sec-independent protein translocase protein TatB